MTPSRETSGTPESDPPFQPEAPTPNNGEHFEPELRGPTPRRLRRFPVEHDIIVFGLMFLVFPVMAAWTWSLGGTGTALGYIFGGVGLFFYSLMAVKARKQYRLLRWGVPARATITGRKDVHIKTEREESIQYAFQAGGREQRGSFLFVPLLDRYVKDGDTMTVLYDPRNPRLHMLYQPARFKRLFAPAPERGR